MKLTSDSDDYISTNVVWLFSFFGEMLELGHVSGHKMRPITDVVRRVN
jgi:hypothetical protein